MIVSHNSSGLCNRLKSWASSLKIDSSCYVNWENKINVRHRDIPFPAFDLLFDNENTPPPSGMAYDRKVMYDRPDDVFTKPVGNDENVLRYYRSPYLAVLPEDRVPRDFIKAPFSEKTIIDHQYHRTPETLKKEYADIFKQFRFKQAFVDQANSYLSKNLSDSQRERLVTVHVRSFCDSPSRKDRWYNIQNFIEKMKCLDDHNVKFYLSVDENSIIQQFKDVFGDKIFYFPKEKDPAEDMGSYQSQVEAIIELFILGKGKTLLATETSTYSEVAWWLGECKPRVHKIGNVIYE